MQRISVLFLCILEYFIVSTKVALEQRRKNLRVGLFLSELVRVFSKNVDQRIPVRSHCTSRIVTE